MSNEKKTTDMKGNGKSALVPKLRFPEFRNNGPWEVKEVGDVFKVTRGEVLAMTLVKDYVSSEAPYPVYSSQTKNKGLAGYYSDYLYQDAITWTTDGANAGDVNFRSGRFYCTNVCGVLIDTRGYANACVAALLNNVTRKHVSYVGNPKLMNGVMAKIGIPFPPLSEQQKIAECLSSVDELIAAQARKVDALKTHKKGLMQQLFPREGETQPRLRFPEFQNDGEWVSVPLGELGDIITGKTPSTQESDLWGGDVLFITPTDISEDDKYQNSTARTVVETKSTKVLPLGSVVYTCIASIGKMAMTVLPSVTNQQINAVVPNKKTLGEFVYYALANLTPWIKTIPASNTLPIINKTVFSKIEILHPKDKDEQQRIAVFLGNLDALIASETQKLEALKLHKRGLMQQLFPSPEEAEA
jgi:type I restriction enzyme, S subunit